MKGKRRGLALALILALLPALLCAVLAEAGTDGDTEENAAYAVRFVIPGPDGTQDVMERLVDRAPDAAVGPLPEDPFSPGMTFLGWQDAETQQEITADMPVDRDLTAVAQFAPIPVYTVAVEYYYRRSDTETVVFDRALLTVDGGRITEDQPLTVPSPLRTEADAAAMQYHDTLDPFFYPEAECVQITRADVEENAETRSIVKSVAYTPGGHRPKEGAADAVSAYTVHYVDGETGEALLPDKAGYADPAENGLEIRERAVPVAGYLPDAWESVLLPESGEREITFRYTAKEPVNRCTVHFVLRSDPDVHVAASETVTVEGDTCLITVLPAPVDKAAMADSGVSEAQLQGWYYPEEACIQYALSADPDSNEIVFYYAQYEQTAFSIRWADMLGDPLPGAGEQTVYARRGETVMLPAAPEGWLLDHAALDGEDLGARAWVTAQGQETADVTLYGKLPAVIAAGERQRVYNGETQAFSGVGDVERVEGLRPGDTLAEIGFSGSRQAVGTAEILPCGARIVDESGRDVTENYALRYEAGTLEVIEYPDPILVLVTGGEFEYDGKAHSADVTVEYLPAGYTLAEARSDAAVTHVSEGTVKARADALQIRNAEGEDVTDRLTLTYTEDLIRITPAPLMIITDSAEKEYDGVALTAAGRVEGLRNGETAAITLTGSQTDAGESENTCVLVFADQAGADEAVTAVSADYDVEERIGTLSVSPLTGVTVTVTGRSGRVDYDGEAHTVSGYDVSISNALYTVADFEFYGVDSVTGVDADVYEPEMEEEDFVNVNGNFADVTFAVERGELVIDPIPVIVTVTGHTDERMFSGAEESVTGYDIAVSNALFTEADFVFDGNDAARGENVGKYTMGLSQDQFHDNNGNFLPAFDVTDGCLTILPRPVTLRAESAAFVYDGETHACGEFTADGLAPGDEVTAEVRGSITFPEESPAVNHLESWAFAAGDPGNYIVTVEDGELTMDHAQAALTLTAASETWTYDGMSHVNPQVTVTAGELFPGDELTAQAAGSVRDVADTAPGNNPVPADCRILHDGRDVTASYRITAVDGTLTVEPLEVTAVVTGSRHRAVYDGEEHVVNGFARQADNALYNPENIALREGVSAHAARRDAGESAMGLTPDSFENLDGNFSVTFVIAEDGWQIVEPRAVTVQITGYTDTAPYDGEEHTVTGYSATTVDWLYHVSRTALRPGEKARASRSELGTAPMGLTADQFENLDDNFSVTYEIMRDGGMTITPAAAAVTITEHSGKKTYDGTEHTLTGYDVLIDHPLYTKSDFIFTGSDAVSGTDAGVYGMDLRPEDFENVNENFGDVTFVIVDGALTVTPRQVILTSDSAEKEYDGEALSGGGVAVSGDGFASGEGADWTVTGSQTFVGESENTFTYALWENTKAENYEITAICGRLAVKGDGVEAELTTPEAEEDYGLGDPIPFLLTVKNVTDGVLTGVRLREGVRDLIPDEGWTLDEEEEAVLADIPSGGQAELHLSHAVTGEDILAGVCAYTVTLVWQETVLTPAAETDRIEAPDVTLDMDVQVISVPANGAAYGAGETVAFAVTVTNRGTVPYENIAVTDNRIGLRQWIAALAVGETVTLTAEYTVTEQDAANGAVVSMATAQAAPIRCAEGSVTPEARGEAVALTVWQYTLTVRYVYPNGDPAAPACVLRLAGGDEFNVSSPAIPGWQPSLSRVQGTMPGRDVTYTVFYVESGNL